MAQEIERQKEKTEAALYWLEHSCGLTEEMFKALSKRLGRHFPKYCNTRAKRCLRLYTALQHIQWERNDWIDADEKRLAEYHKNGIDPDPFDPDELLLVERIDRRLGRKKYVARWSEFDRGEDLLNFFNNSETPREDIARFLASKPKNRGEGSRQNVLIECITRASRVLSCRWNRKKNRPPE